MVTLSMSGFLIEMLHNNYCEKTGLWWLVYEEGNGMFNLLCKMHNYENPFNHQKKFNQIPAVRFKRVH